MWEALRPARCAQHSQAGNFWVAEPPNSSVTPVPSLLTLASLGDLGEQTVRVNFESIRIAVGGIKFCSVSPPRQRVLCAESLPSTHAAGYLPPTPAAGSPTHARGQILSPPTPARCIHSIPIWDIASAYLRYALARDASHQPWGRFSRNSSCHSQPSAPYRKRGSNVSDRVSNVSYILNL